jgi:hypothetical protein
VQVAKQQAKQFLVSQNVPLFIADPASDSAQQVRPSAASKLPEDNHTALHIQSMATIQICRLQKARNSRADLLQQHGSVDM